MTPIPTNFVMDDDPLLLPVPHLPSMHPPPSTKVRLDHFSNMYPPEADTASIYQLSPEQLIDKALKTLQDAGIQLIEWLSLLHRRMNVPVIIKVSSILFYLQNPLYRAYRTSTTSSQMNSLTWRPSWSLR